MKKRILSFLLLLSMLVSVIPVMGLSTAAEEGDVPRSETFTNVSDYYSLYKTEGLFVFFDALTEEGDTVDLAEGKWYAKVYDEATGTFVKSTEYYATLEGGAYDVEENPTGWRIDGAGLGYDDPAYEATGNKLTIRTKGILYRMEGMVTYRKANWTIEGAIKTTLRQSEVAEGEFIGEALGAYRLGPIYARRATNLFGKNADGLGEGATRWFVSAAMGDPWSGAMTNGTDTSTDSFVLNDGKVTTLVANKSTASDRSVAFTVTHGGVSVTGGLTRDTVADSDLVLLGGEQGRVYSLRIYLSDTAQPITETELRVNASVDTLIRLGVSLDKFNEMSDALKDQFLAEELPSLTVTTKADVENAIDSFIAKEAAKDAARQQSAYDSLYVGADGSKTANGGELVALFTSYAGDPSAMLDEGVWLNKMKGGIDATLGGKEYWYKNEAGGVGFRIFAGMVKDDGTFSKTSPYDTMARYHGTNEGLNIRLQLGLDMLPDEDYTVEWVANYKYIESVNEKGESVGDMLAAYVAANPGQTNSPYGSHEYTAPIDVIGGVASWTTHLTGYFSSGTLRGATAWGIAENIRWDASGGKHGHAGNLITRDGAFASQNSVHSYAISLDEEHFTDFRGTAQINADFHLWKDASSYDIKTMTTENAQNNKNDKYYDLPDDFGDFYLSSSLPTEFYACRVYSAALTAEEMRWNRFVDLAAYAGASLNDFNKLDPATQASVLKSMAVQPFMDADGFYEMLAEIVALYESIVKAEDTLYVQDGLVLLTAAYKNLHTGAVGTDVITWLNAVDNDKNISIRGGMELRADGGYYKLQTLDEWNAGHDYGYYVDNSLLVEGDYTLELIINPTGIVAYDPDGNADRYIDETSQHGIYDRNHQLGFAIGPLRCLSFVGARPEGQSGGVHNRWMYNRGNYCWDNVPYVNGVAQRNQIMVDSWNDNTTFDKIITHNIVCDYDEYNVKDTYRLYTDFVETNWADIKAEDRITNAEGNNYFQLMVGFPGGMFSVRLYNRILTEAEMLQNRGADLIYHYGLDTTLLDKVLEIFAEDTTKVYRGLSDMSFNLDKEDAQRIFDGRLSALWLSCTDFAIRGNNKDGIRFYFEMDEDSATKMLAGGYQIEIGALVNIGQNARPTLDGHNYDYKILAYDGIGGKNEGFFIDEDTFAVTLFAKGSNSFSYLQSIKIQGYIELITPEGERLTFYIEPSFEDVNTDTFFDIYEYAQASSGYISEVDLLNYLSECTFKCYEKYYVYVKADAPDGGDGTKDAPYNDFAVAMAGAKEKLQKINSPTHFIVQLDDGVYEVHEIVTFGIEDMPYPFCRFQISSKNNKSTLTSNRTIDTDGFVSVGDNLWKYQFAQSSDGSYPFFRNLYINGAIAEMSHNGALDYFTNEPMYMQRLERTAEGAFSNAKSLYSSGKLTADMLFYPEENVEMNTRFAYYRDIFCAYDELRKMPAESLTLTTGTSLAEPTANYLEWFEYYRDYWIIYNELNAAYKNPEIGNNLPRTALEAMKDLTTKTEGADDDFKALFATQLATFLETLEKGNVTKARDAILPPLVSAAITTPFSSGVYAQVSAMLAEDTLTYTSAPASSELKLAQGVQFIYYRDALLALRDVQALGDGVDLSATPNAEGSEQYKEMFLSVLYDTVAINELKAMKKTLEAEANGSATWKAALAQATTAVADAPEAYVKAFTLLRNSFVVKDFAGFTSYKPTVEEADGPYNGNIPMYDPISQGKLYMKEGVAGEFLKDTVAAALDRMAEDAVALVAKAEAEYNAAYAALVDALEGHTALVLAGKTADAATYSTKNVVPARGVASAAYEAYLAAVQTAAEYVSGDTNDRYSLKDTDIESRLIFMWNFNILHVMGIDYDDYLNSWDGEKNVAVYFDLEHWASAVISSEWYITNRVTSLQNAPEFLDTEGEYYYNAQTGELYYYGKSLNGLSFEYPTMDNMLYFSHAEKMTLLNLAFTGLDNSTVSTDGYFGGQAGACYHENFLGQQDYFPSRAPVYVWHAKNFTVTGCTFHDLGCDGLTMRGRVENTLIEGNTFERLGAAAFRSVGKPNLTASFTYQSGSENVEFTNNYIDGAAQDLYNSVAVQFAYSKDITISYNTIQNCSYTGISVGWNWSYSGFQYGKGVKLMHVDICNNYILNFMQQMGDGGAIYTLGGNATWEHEQPFNWSHDNYILFTNKTGDGLNTGSVIGNYHDGGSSHWSTYDNVVVAYSYGAGSTNGHYTETMTYAKFMELSPDTHLSWQEYGKRMQTRAQAITPYYTQDWIGANGSTDAHAGRIYYDGNYLINSRATVTGSDKNQGTETAHYEAFVGCIFPGAPYYSETKNTHYVKNPAYLPTGAEDIMYEAGCDRMKGDPMDIADNNY